MGNQLGLTASDCHEQCRRFLPDPHDVSGEPRNSTDPSAADGGLIKVEQTEFSKNTNGQDIAGGHPSSSSFDQGFTPEVDQHSSSSGVVVTAPSTSKAASQPPPRTQTASQAGPKPAPKHAAPKHAKHATPKQAAPGKQPTAYSIAPNEQLVQQLVAMGFPRNGSMRACIMVENAGLEQATDWVRGLRTPRRLLLHRSHRTTTNNYMIPSMQVLAHTDDPDFNDPVRVDTSPKAKREQQLKELTSMGFSRSLSEKALDQAKGNQDIAADMLLTGYVKEGPR